MLVVFKSSQVMEFLDKKFVGGLSGKSMIVKMIRLLE